MRLAARCIAESAAGGLSEPLELERVAKRITTTAVRSAAERFAATS